MEEPAATRAPKKLVKRARNGTVVTPALAMECAAMGLPVQSAVRLVFLRAREECRHDVTVFDVRDLLLDAVDALSKSAWADATTSSAATATDADETSTTTGSNEGTRGPRRQLSRKEMEQEVTFPRWFKVANPAAIAGMLVVHLEVGPCLRQGHGEEDLSPGVLMDAFVRTMRSVHQTLAERATRGKTPAAPVPPLALGDMRVGDAKKSNETPLVSFKLLQVPVDTLSPEQLGMARKALFAPSTAANLLSAEDNDEDPKEGDLAILDPWDRYVLAAKAMESLGYPVAKPVASVSLTAGMEEKQDGSDDEGDDDDGDVETGAAGKETEAHDASSAAKKKRAAPPASPTASEQDQGVASTSGSQQSQALTRKRARTDAPDAGEMAAERPQDKQDNDDSARSGAGSAAPTLVGTLPSHEEACRILDRLHAHQASRLRLPDPSVHGGQFFATCDPSSMHLLHGEDGTPAAAGVAPTHSLLGIDCEMCGTTRGDGLTRVSLVGERHRTVLDQLVKPRDPIVDYRSQYSGITRDMLEGVDATLQQVQLAFLRMVSANTVLVGHSLENDLRSLHICHTRCVDTVVLYPHRRGLPFRSSLKFLCKEYLHREIQTSDDGHDSVDDARAALELAQLKLDKGPRFGLKPATDNVPLLCVAPPEVNSSLANGLNARYRTLVGGAAHATLTVPAQPTAEAQNAAPSLAQAPPGTLGASSSDVSIAALTKAVNALVPSADAHCGASSSSSSTSSSTPASSDKPSATATKATSTTPRRSCSVLLAQAPVGLTASQNDQEAEQEQEEEQEAEARGVDIDPRVQAQLLRLLSAQTPNTLVVVTAQPGSDVPFALVGQKRACMGGRAVSRWTPELDACLNHAMAAVCYGKLAAFVTPVSTSSLNR